MRRLKVLHIIILSAAAGLCTVAFCPAAFADAVSERLKVLQGSWTTYRVPNQQIALAKWDLNFRGSTVQLQGSVIFFTPLVRRDGLDVSLSGEVVSARDQSDSQGRPFVELEYTLTRYQIRYMTGAGVSEANRNAYCGLTNWQAGVFKDVSGLTCKEAGEDSEPQTYPKAGRSLKLQVASADGRIYASLDDSGEEQTPTIAWDRPLYRKP